MMRIVLVIATLAITLAAASEASARLNRSGADDEQRCHASYPDFCIPPPPPDLDCRDIDGPKPFRVRHNVANPDPHRFDRDEDGYACETRPRRRSR